MPVQASETHRTSPARQTPVKQGVSGTPHYTLTSKQIEDLMQKIGLLKNPAHDRVAFRSAAAVASNQQAPTIQLKPVKLHPDTPTIAEPDIEQSGSIEELGYYLLANADIKEILDPKDVRETAVASQKESQILAQVGV